MKKVILLFLCCIAFVACNKSYDKMSPAQQEKEYVQFQKDSLKQCTQNERLAKSAIEGAFDRIPENNGYFKKDKVTVNYVDSLQCWVGTVKYHVDRNNTYYQASKTFHVKYWCEYDGLAKDMQIFYTVQEVK